MIYVENNVINLTRGDDAVLTVPLKTQDGEEYTLGDEEFLIFSVREFPTEDSELLIEIESDPGSNQIVFTHDITANLNCGLYSAEVQMITDDGLRYTVWPKLSGASRYSTKTNRKNFCLMTEVVRV